MIYQTDEAFEPDIQHFGCYFLSLLWQLNRLFGVPELDHKVIEVIYGHEKADHDMAKEAYIENPQGLVDSIIPNKVHFVGKVLAPYTCQPGEFAIQCWYNPATDFHHFVAEASDGSVGYDPIEGGSRTVREGHLESKRIYLVV
jgi:hypothetical protein